jgi:crossover junction endodeoxyribonuclease RuvC
MLTLGVDPGLNRTGYAVLRWEPHGPKLEEGGVIQSSAGLSLAERVWEIAHGLREVIQEFRPESMAVELVFSHTQYPKTAVLMAHARGAILFTARDHGLPIEHYTPTQIKRTLTGSGRASKDQMQRAIQHELRLRSLPEPHDVADACAVAVCHGYALRFQRRFPLTS